MGVSLGSKSKQGASPDINITPLVDVVLVLLIIFMVVTPAINEGAQIELPQVQTPDPKTKHLNPIEVTIAPDGTTVCDKQIIEPDRLRAKLLALHEKEPERALLLKSDEAMRWGKMRKTFFELQDIGFKGVLLKVTEKKTKAGGGA